MIKAFVLIRITPGYEVLVKDKLKDFDEVKEINMLYGEWDLIINIESEDLKQLKEFIIKKIRNIKGVVETSTLICADYYE